MSEYSFFFFFFFFFFLALAVGEGGGDAAEAGAKSGHGSLLAPFSSILGSPMINGGGFLSSVSCFILSYKGAVLAMCPDALEVLGFPPLLLLVSFDRYSRPSLVYLTRSFRLLWRVRGPQLWSSLIINAEIRKMQNELIGCCWLLVFLLSIITFALTFVGIDVCHLPQLMALAQVGTNGVLFLHDTLWHREAQRCIGGRSQDPGVAPFLGLLAGARVPAGLGANGALRACRAGRGTDRGVGCGSHALDATPAATNRTVLLRNGRFVNVIPDDLLAFLKLLAAELVQLQVEKGLAAETGGKRKEEEIEKHRQCQKATVNELSTGVFLPQNGQFVIKTATFCLFERPTNMSEKGTESKNN